MPGQVLGIKLKELSYAAAGDVSMWEWYTFKAEIPYTVLHKAILL